MERDPESKRSVGNGMQKMLVANQRKGEFLALYCINSRLHLGQFLTQIGTSFPESDHTMIFHITIYLRPPGLLHSGMTLSHKSISQFLVKQGPYISWHSARSRGGLSTRNNRHVLRGPWAPFHLHCSSRLLCLLDPSQAGLFSF